MSVIQKRAIEDRTGKICHFTVFVDNHQKIREFFDNLEQIDFEQGIDVYEIPVYSKQIKIDFERGHIGDQRGKTIGMIKKITDVDVHLPIPFWSRLKNFILRKKVKDIVKAPSYVIILKKEMK